jgi:DUF4097 and DUF4098 domain-containing protein YvlB
VETVVVSVEMVKKAWGENSAAAQAAAEALQVAVQEDETSLKLEYLQSGPEDLIVIGSYHPNSVSFRIKVPVQTTVVLKTRNGGINLSGTTGRAKLDSSFGEVIVSGVRGALEINAEVTALTVEDVQAGEQDILMNTSFAPITANNLAGREIRLVASNGQILAHQIKAAGRLSIKDQFAGVDLETVSAAALEVDNQNGEVKIRSSQVTGRLQVITSFDALEIDGVEAADYILETNNGSLVLDEAHGSLNLSNRFGDITVTNAVDAILDIRTGNGKVDFSGSLDEGGSHLIESTFGDVILSLPVDSSLDLELETSFGKIQSDLPVTLSGEISETRWQAILNAGESVLKATTSNGNILLQELKADER